MSNDRHFHEARSAATRAASSEATGGWRIKQRKDASNIADQELNLSIDDLESAPLKASVIRGWRQFPSVVSDFLRSTWQSLQARYGIWMRFWMRFVREIWQKMGQPIRLAGLGVLVVGGGTLFMQDREQRVVESGSGIVAERANRSLKAKETSPPQEDAPAQQGRYRINAIALPALENEGYLPVYFRLKEPAEEALNITYKTVSHTASADSDFAAQTGTVTIEPGDISVELEIPLINDDVLESIEMFRVLLSIEQSSASLNDKELMATVIDDDKLAPTRSN